MGTAPVGPTGPPERRRLTRADRLENREDTVKENLIRRWIRHEQATLQPNGYPEEGEIVIWIYRHNDDLLNDFAKWNLFYGKVMQVRKIGDTCPWKQHVAED